MRFAFSYSTPFRALATLLGMGPTRSAVEVTDTHIDVRMGWAFHARIPREAVRAVEQPARIPFAYGWGVHGWGGSWAVNGAQSGAVRLAIDPPARARVLGIPVRLHELYLSLEEPEAFARATRR